MMRREKTMDFFFFKERFTVNYVIFLYSIFAVITYPGVLISGVPTEKVLCPSSTAA